MPAEALVTQALGFEPLGYQHRHLFDEFANRFGTYSDINFLSLLAWDLDGMAAVGQLDDWTVVRLSDYITGAPIYTALSLDPARSPLADVVQSLGELHLVPAPMIDSSDRNRNLAWREQPDQFDYVTDVNNLSAKTGRSYQSFRHSLAVFQRVHGADAELNFETQVEDGLAASILRLHTTATHSRGLEGRREQRAFAKLMLVRSDFTLVWTLLVLKGELVGFSVAETGFGTEAIAHFHGADRSLRGSYDYLNLWEARHLAALGVQSLNLEQDLGLPGLRIAKKRLCPAELRRKYAIKFM